MRWVVEIQEDAGNRHEWQAQTASPVTVTDPLQLMPKKKKKKTVAAVGGESEVTAEASGGAGPGADVGVVPAHAGGEPPVPLPGSEDTPAAAQPEGSAVAGENKQKKKPRAGTGSVEYLAG